MTFTHQVGDGLHSAIIKAVKPAFAELPMATTTPVGRTTLPMAAGSACC